MELNYDLIFPVILGKMFVEKQDREEIEVKLNQYGSEPFHIEVNRVKVGILYLHSVKGTSIDEVIRLACGDFRALVVAAESPYTTEFVTSQSKRSKRYIKAKSKQDNEYFGWIKQFSAL
jgi:hypothetical protein